MREIQEMREFLKYDARSLANPDIRQRIIRLSHVLTTLCFLSERVKCENYLVSYILSDQTRHLYIYLNGLRAIQSLVNLTRMVNLYNPVI